MAYCNPLDDRRGAELVTGSCQTLPRLTRRKHLEQFAAPRRVSLALKQPGLPIAHFPPRTIVTCYFPRICYFKKQRGLGYLCRSFVCVAWVFVCWVGWLVFACVGGSCVWAFPMHVSTHVCTDANVPACNVCMEARG